MRSSFGRMAKFGGAILYRIARLRRRQRIQRREGASVDGRGSKMLWKFCFCSKMRLKRTSGIFVLFFRRTLR